MINAKPLLPNGLAQRIFRTRAEDRFPLGIEHQRIYIVPSQRGFAFLLALAICLVASINYQLNLGYALSFLLSGLFIASLLHTYRNLAGLTLEKLNAADVDCGDKAQFALQLRNASRQDRIGIEIRYDGGREVTDVPAQQSTTIRLPVQTTQRGYHSIGRITLSSQYPIGLWSTWSYCHAPATVLVYPKAEQNPPPIPYSQLDDSAPNLATSSDGDVASLREYQPGDPLTRVAWKQAARSGKLQVRELETANTSGAIELALPDTKLSDTELQLSRLYAWVKNAHQGGSVFTLRLGLTQFGPGQGSEHYKACAKALAEHALPTNTATQLRESNH